MADRDTADETAAAEFVNEETAVVPDAARAESTQLAWSDVTLPAIEPEAERRPLPIALKLLLAGVGIAALVVGAFALGQNHSAPPPKAASTPAAAAAPTSSPTTVAPTATAPHGYIDDQDRVFLSTLSTDSYFADVPRDSMIDAAHKFCNRANSGQKADAMNELLKLGMSLEHVTNFAYSATVAYCPGQLSGVQ